jgi:hypothetical protein
MKQLLVACAAALLACRPSETKPPVIRAEPMANDTLRGTFVLEGSDPYPMAVMRTSSGRVILDGASARMLKLSQLDLWVRGTQTSASRFRVADYRVRSANGARAWDGVLRSGPLGFRLELDDGSSHDIRGAPSSFGQLIGSRVWVTESPDGTLSQYGLL